MSADDPFLDKQIVQILTKTGVLYRVRQPLPQATGQDPAEPVYIANIEQIVNPFGTTVYWIVSHGVPGSPYAVQNKMLLTEIPSDEVLREDAFVAVEAYLEGMRRMQAEAAAAEAEAANEPETPDAPRSPKAEPEEPIEAFAELVPTPGAEGTHGA